MADEDSGSSKKLQNFHNSIIKWGFKSENETGDEIIDIVSDYPWVLDTSSANNYKDISFNTEEAAKINLKNNDVAFCYAIERKSALNAGLANIFSMLNQLSENTGKGIDTLGSILGLTADNLPKGNIADNVKDITSNVVSTAHAFNKKISDFVKSFGGKATQNNNLNSDILAPYKYLYITQPTEKKFVFPLLSQDASFSPVKNTWGATSKLPGILESPLSIAKDAIDSFSALANLTSQVLSLRGGTSVDIGNHREIAKSYTYPQDGDSLTVNFTLYNTTKLNAWKDNYRFLFLFILRNLPLRIDTTSFIPPLLYDIYVPGSKRLPVCSVGSINVNPKGMMRTMKCPNIIPGYVTADNNMVVNIPEAWEVSIVFKSLIAPSINLMFEGYFGGANIGVTVSTASAPGK